MPIEAYDAPLQRFCAGAGLEYFFSPRRRSQIVKYPHGPFHSPTFWFPAVYEGLQTKPSFADISAFHRVTPLLRKPIDAPAIFWR